MNTTITLFCNNSKELNNFLSSFYNVNMDIEPSLSWEKKYANPIELADLIGVYIDNIDNFDISMWISLDKNLYISITEDNANSIIKYLFERYPY